MESIKLMAEFTEILKNDPKHAYDFISNNYTGMDKTELVAVIKKLLCAIQCDCCLLEIEKILVDVAIELDEQYEEQYEGLQHMKR